MLADQIMQLASKHEGQNSSSAFCYNDALIQHYKGNDEAAHRWALRSLEHSVGIFHPDFKAAKALIEA